MAKVITTESGFEQADHEIKPHDLVTVIGTGSSKHMPFKKSYVVHTELAAKLVANGSATLGSKVKRGKPTSGQSEIDN